MTRVLGDLDELATAVRHAAHGDGSRRRKDAREQADRLRHEAKRDSEQLRRRILDEAQREAEAIARQKRLRADEERRGQRLEQRARRLDDIENRAREVLERLMGDDDQYLEVLERLVGEALEALGAGDYEVVADERGHALLTSERLDAWRRSAGHEGKLVVGGTTERWGGVVLQEENGRRAIDATFETRLRLARQRYGMQLIEELRS
jgi:vacuolar-type H+-ATPase subunit E/Vma4